MIKILDHICVRWIHRLPPTVRRGTRWEVRWTPSLNDLALNAWNTNKSQDRITYIFKREGLFQSRVTIPDFRVWVPIYRCPPALWILSFYCRAITGPANNLPLGNENWAAWSLSRNNVCLLCPPAFPPISFIYFLLLLPCMGLIIHELLNKLKRLLREKRCDALSLKPSESHTERNVLAGTSVTMWIWWKRKKMHV